MKRPMLPLVVAAVLAPIGAAQAAGTTLFLQAETAANATDCGSGFATTGGGSSGTAYANCRDDATAFVQWSVHQQTAGRRHLDFRYQNTALTRPAELTVNGAVVGTLDFVAAS